MSLLSSVKFKLPSLDTGIVIFLAILAELHPDTLPASRIWLFCFNPYFFKQFPLPEKHLQQGCAQMRFLELFVMLLLVLLVTVELHGSLKTMTAAHLTGTRGPSERADPYFNSV